MLRSDQSYRHYILPGNQRRPLTMMTTSTRQPHRPPPIAIERSESTDALLGEVVRETPLLPWEGRQLRPDYYGILGISDRAASPQVPSNA